MSDLTDYYMEKSFGWNMRNYEKYLEDEGEMGCLVWTTKEGKEVAVEDMTPAHIYACITAINEGRITFPDEEIKKAWLMIFDAELELRENDVDV